MPAGAQAQSVADFYKGKTGVKATTTLRNADLGGLGTFTSAFKGLAAYEWRLAPALNGAPRPPSAYTSRAAAMSARRLPAAAAGPRLIRGTAAVLGTGVA